MLPLLAKMLFMLAMTYIVKADSSDYGTAPQPTLPMSLTVYLNRVAPKIPQENAPGCESGDIVPHNVQAASSEAPYTATKTKLGCLC